jgi:segregation and condensation protein B
MAEKPEPPKRHEANAERAANYIEAVLFAAGCPVSLRKLGELTGLSPMELKVGLEKLAARYAAQRSAIEVVKVSSRKYVMQLKSAYAEYIWSRGADLEALKLPKSLLRTLTYIGYLQPVRQAVLKKLCGSQVYTYVKTLEELGLVRARRERRSKVLTLTSKFFEYFGLPRMSMEKLKECLAARVKALGSAAWVSEEKEE